MTEFGCATSRILWVKFKSASVKLCVAEGYGTAERREDKEARYSGMASIRFWIAFVKCIACV